MMRNTPRAFVGSVVFLLDGHPCSRTVDAVHAALGQVPEIGSCRVDVTTGTLVVTALRPVDRAEVIAMLDRLGCQVRT